jgi:biopolymer transport protein ExbD
MITGINVTPLVDVVLVLLIVFMATAPLVHRRVLNVSVPRTAHNERKAAATVQVFMTEAREVYIEDEKHTPETVGGALQTRLRLDPALHISVAADKSIPYGEVVSLLDVIRSAGVKKVALDVQAK